MISIWMASYTIIGMMTTAWFCAMSPEAKQISTLEATAYLVFWPLVLAFVVTDLGDE